MIWAEVERLDSGTILSAKIVDQPKGRPPPNVECRLDWTSFEEVEVIAEELNHWAAATDKVERYIPVDQGEWVSPRYEIVQMWKIGDFVSYHVNGDHYPDGEIVRISPSGKRIVTSSGKTYYRLQRTDRWKYDRVWTMELGRVEKLNPHF